MDAKAPVKEETKSDSASFWCVTITHHTDCYKRAYGVSTNGPFVFRAKEYAVRFLRRRLHDWCDERRYECQQYMDEEEKAKDNKLWKEAHASLEAMEAFIREHYNQGEFVPKLIEWKIEEQEFCDEDEPSDDENCTGCTGGYHNGEEEEEEEESEEDTKEADKEKKEEQTCLKCGEPCSGTGFYCEHHQQEEDSKKRKEHDSKEDKPSPKRQKTE